MAPTCPRPAARFAALALLSLTALCLPASPSFAGDWTFWRGPSMDGTSDEVGLPSAWDPKGGEGSNLLWKRDDLGTRSSPVVMGGRVFFLARHNVETPQEQEKVVCLDAATGETVWETVSNIFLTDVPDTRVAWSNVTADPETGQVYALTVCGLFQCLKAETGDVVWERSMAEEFGLLSTYGGRTNMPIVVDDLVIISGVVIGWGENAKPAHRFLGFDKRTGEVRWFESTRLLPDDTTYSSPVLTSFDGEPSLVFGAGDGGIYGFQPLTGKRQWKYDVSSRGINTTPLVDHATGMVFCGHSEENLTSTEMGALFGLSGSQADGEVSSPKWKQEGLFVGKSAPLMVDGRLYAIDDRAKLHIVDPQTGEVLGTQRMGTMQRVSPVYADGKIYTAEANGRIYVLEPDGDDVKFLCKERLGRGEECHGSPAIADGRIFWPSTGAMYCIGTGGEAKQTGESNLPEIPLTASEGEPTQLQIVPAEKLITAGESVGYRVRLFNDKGQFLREADPSEVTFAVETNYSTEVEPGGAATEPELTMSGNTLETAAAGFLSGTVTASLNGSDLTGSGRVRVEKELDWRFTFDDQLVPDPWIGVAYRMVSLDGELLSRLQTEDPVAADLYIYLGSSLINSGAPALTFDDSTPALKWSDLLRFFNRSQGAERPQTVEASKELLGGALDRLKTEGVLAGYEWSTWKRSDADADRPRLKVMRGNLVTGGDGQLVKIRTIPKGTRSQSWMGSPDLSDYTIQADVKGFARDGKLPDIGLINQRYTLDLMGAAQQLQIRTWTPQLYKANQTPVSWEPNTWYTLKFTTQNSGDGSLTLRGKVWPKGDPEPEEWTVETTDAFPSTHGSPGLFGNAKDSEILYDNISVTKN